MVRVHIAIIVYAAVVQTLALNALSCELLPYHFLTGQGLHLLIVNRRHHRSYYRFCIAVVIIIAGAIFLLIFSMNYDVLKESGGVVVEEVLV